MGYIDIEPDALYELEDAVLVDIRSPQEFEDFHIPGAVNVPLFENEEKKLIGYVYRNKGAEQAFELGREIASKRLMEFYERFKELKSRNKNVIVYCWRGGMRSQSMCQVMADMGLELMRLRGGYRAYREFILSDMERLVDKLSFIVITGRTGVGKTKVLRRLREEGLPALDLEGLARNRGSVFGSVGIEEKVSQKMFDALLYEELRRLGEGFVFVEDESRRVGNVHIPEPVWRRKCEGIYVELQADMGVRIENIKGDYMRTPGWKEQSLEAIRRIKKHLGPQRFSHVQTLFEEDKFDELIGFLIEEYYDKRYKQFGEPVATFGCNNIEECVNRLKEFYIHLSHEGKVQNIPI